MEELGAVINLANQTISFLTIGVKDKPLLKTSKGHLALNLLDFNLDQLDDFESEDECDRNSKSTAAQPHGPQYQSEPVEETGEDQAKLIAEALDGYEYPPDFSGMNPDDYYDHQDWLATLKQDVAGYQDDSFQEANFVW